MGEIAVKTNEFWLIFSFSDLWLLAINFSGFCLRRNLILCSILDILGFGWAKSHEKWKSYGPFSVFPIFEHFLSIKFFLRRNFILCSIPDIFSFGWLKLQVKWARYGCFSVFPIFNTFHQFSGFCVGRNFILCSIPDILGFEWVKSHEKWARNGWLSVL